jgi:hypothetical protein
MAARFEPVPDTFAYPFSPRTKDSRTPDIDLAQVRPRRAPEQWANPSLSGFG